MGYDLSVSRARDPLIVITIFVVVALVTVVLRLQARRLRKTPFGLDDGFMLAATVSIYLHFVRNGKCNRDKLFAELLRRAFPEALKADCLSPATIASCRHGY